MQVPRDSPPNECESPTSYPSPSRSSKEACTKRKRHDGMGDTPRRRALREKAHMHMLKQADKMRRRAAAADGRGPVLSVGQVVYFSIADVDRAKVDSTTATAVIVEVVWCGEKKNPEQVKYRLACRAGVLDTLRHRSYLKPLPPHVTPTLLGLDDALLHWKSMKLVGERACARFLSSVGGQGLVHCACTGPCDSGKCKCFKAGRECNSRCHKRSNRCVNTSYVACAADVDSRI